MSETSTLIGYQGRTISRQELALIPTYAQQRFMRCFPGAVDTHSLFHSIFLRIILTPPRLRIIL